MRAVAALSRRMAESLLAGKRNSKTASVLRSPLSDSPGGAKKAVTSGSDETVEVKVETSNDGKEQFVFFFGNKSPFSQWHPVNFVVDGVRYNCAEQYMMHQKAVLFKDEKMAQLILASKDPREQKRLGRAVSNFQAEVWSQECRNVVKKANKAKFSQNPHLKKYLLKTGGATLVEAAPRDRIWGIGLGSKNPKAKDRRNWRGRNWLGYALTEVRDALIKSEKQPEEDATEETAMIVEYSSGEAAATAVEQHNEPGSSKEKFTFFWQTKSCFSQWHPSEFTVDGIRYKSAKQYMMHQKAVLFKDEDIAEAILHAKESRKQEALGRKVDNFDEETWNLNCQDIVKRGNRAKFSQNAEMKKELLATVGTTLVEASPYDKIWGIGLKSSDPLAVNRKTWNGKNWLGFILTEVRDEFLKEQQV